MTRFFGALVIPAICTAAVLYFGYYFIWGTRGVLELTAAQAKLALAQQQLADVEQDNARLKHRIELLGSEDPDIIEEIARDQLLGTTPGQIAVPRDKR
ncbi:MAG TPA: septum formation initiator family protein [Rhizomicrobium sp.]